jgi:hypothetical protein
MKKKDFIFIGAIILTAIILFAAFSLVRDKGSYVIIRIDGVEVAKYSLNENGEYLLNGGSNILVIKDGKAYIKYADCPDKLCVKLGEISKQGEVITCLPNKLTVTVYGAENDVEISVD